MELLTRGAAVLEAISRDPRIENISVPLLLYTDLHKRNILVDPKDPTKITVVIDWHSTCLGPASLYFQYKPDLCSSDQQPGFDGGRNAEEAARQDTSAKDVAICQQTWDLGLKAWAQRLYAAQKTDESLTRPFLY